MLTLVVKDVTKLIGNMDLHGWIFLVTWSLWYKLYLIKLKMILNPSAGAISKSYMKQDGMIVSSARGQKTAEC